MIYYKSKVYFDGSHYIAIPHTTHLAAQKRSINQDTVVVQQDCNGNIVNVAGVEADTYDAQIAALTEMGIMTDEILQHMGTENDTPMVAEAAMLVANLYQYHTGQV